MSFKERKHKVHLSEADHALAREYLAFLAKYRKKKWQERRRRFYDRILRIKNKEFERKVGLTNADFSDNPNNQVSRPYPW